MMSLAQTITLLSPIYVPLIISALLFFQFEKRSFSKSFLGFFMLNTTLVFIGNFYYFTQDFETYALMHPLHIHVVLCIYPGIYTYIVSLLKPNFKLKQHIWHYVPAFTYLLVTSLIFFGMLGDEERYYFLTEYRHYPDFSKPVLKLLFIIRISNMALLFGQIFFYGIKTNRLMKKHRQEIENTFSSPDKFRLSWIKSFNSLFLFTAISSIGFYAIDPAKVFGNELVLALPLFCFSLAIWFFGIMGINQQSLNIPPEPEEQKDEVFPVDVESSSVLFQRIQMYLKESKSYLNPDLKIYDLCRELGSNRTYISNAINEEANMNFSTFVNRFRIDEAKILIEKQPDWNLEELAMQAGFGSQSSFIRSFKLHAGMSPSAYRESLLVEAN